MLVDANLLIYAVDRSSPHHDRSRAWLTEVLDGDHRVGLPWQTLGAFLRITTHPRISARPLSAEQAWSCIDGWLDLELTWIPEPGPGYGRILRRLIHTAHPTGNLVPDAMLAALAIEHGAAVCSADGDFARFGDLTWFNPLRT